jgi:glutamate formiminotransferase
MQLIEAVPNISLGRDAHALAQIRRDVARAGQAQLLHADTNADANRTVLTIAGDPEQVRLACLALYKSALSKIDMRTQHGAHPRLGAVDVCPLVPVKGITLQETARYAGLLARDVAQQLEIPVYLYEENATTAQRKNLAFIRRGEYESLPEKLKTLPPDFGPAQFNARVAQTGATIIGARHFLIAFNISLATQDVQLAKQIAARLREKNGGLPAVKAIGWYMPAYGCAQVSFNLTDFHRSNLPDVFEACKAQAHLLGTDLVASELIGLIPQEAVLAAGKFYAPDKTDENDLIVSAVEHLLLDKVRPFNARERILENLL